MSFVAAHRPAATFPLCALPKPQVAAALPASHGGFSARRSHLGLADTCNHFCSSEFSPQKTWSPNGAEAFWEQKIRGAGIVARNSCDSCTCFCCIFLLPAVLLPLVRIRSCSPGAVALKTPSSCALAFMGSEDHQSAGPCSGTALRMGGPLPMMHVSASPGPAARA